MTLSQSHDTPLGHKQYLCKVRTSHVSLKKKIWTSPDTYLSLFMPMNMNFPDWPRFKIMPYLSHKQSMFEVNHSNKWMVSGYFTHQSLLNCKIWGKSVTMSGQRFDINIEFITLQNHSFKNKCHIMQYKTCVASFLQ